MVCTPAESSLSINCLPSIRAPKTGRRIRCVLRKSCAVGILESIRDRYPPPMEITDSSIGTTQALGWKVYSVSRSDKAPLLEFVTKALEARNCQIVFASQPNRAPFYVVFDTPAGDRQGLLIYAFFANSKLTKNRPGSCPREWCS